MLDTPLSKNQTVAVLFMFQFGSSVVVGLNSTTVQDSWIALLLSVLYIIPTLLIYARIIRLNPKVDLYTALGYNFGKVVGKIAAALMAWYALHLCALVLRNFTEFIQVTSLMETPQFVVVVIMLIAVSFLAHAGVKALGKWAVLTAPIVVGFVLITVVLSLNIYKYDNILPVFEHSVAELTRDAFQIYSFPFAETVIFLGVADKLDTRLHPMKLYFKALGVATMVLVLVTMRNLFVLGQSMLLRSYFPSYMAARNISLGDFLARIEGSISANFILAGITKITLCLIVATRGIAYLFGVDDWKHLILPTGLLATMLSVIMYQDTMEMFAFIRYYPYYALPFQVLLPGALWIVSEVKMRKKRPERQTASA